MRVMLEVVGQRRQRIGADLSQLRHARRLLAGLEFDLIVMDVMMQGEDGISLTRDLRTRLRTIESVRVSRATSPCQLSTMSSSSSPDVLRRSR